MEPIQQYAAMIFGAALAVAGVVLMLVGHKEEGRNAVELWGQKIELSTPALAVFLVGSVIFVMPFLLPPREPSGGPPARSAAPARSPARPGVPVASGRPGDAVPKPEEPSRPTVATESASVTAEVTDFSMTGELARLSIRLVSRDKAAVVCVSPEKATLVDEQTGQEWKPASFSDSSGCAGYYMEGSSHAYWMSFPVGQGSQTTFTAHVPGLAQPVKRLELR